MSRRRMKKTFSDLTQGSDDELPSTSQGRRQRNEKSRGSSLSQVTQNSQNDKSQTSRSQSKQYKIHSADELTYISNSVIRYLLIMDGTKFPIPKTNIVKQVLQDGNKNYRQTMEVVNARLSRIFGYKLVDLPGNKYILVNKLENINSYLTFTPEERKHQVLLFIVLAHILMCNNECTENELWNFLTKLDILNETDEEHIYFGDVKRTITSDFVSQNYLELTLEDKEESSKQIFHWGVRAVEEVCPQRVLQFVCEVYGGRSASSWPQQLKTVKQLMKEAKSDDEEDT